jgi:hypothetical protein
MHGAKQGLKQRHHICEKITVEVTHLERTSYLLKYYRRSHDEEMQKQCNSQPFPAIIHLVPQDLSQRSQMGTHGQSGLQLQPAQHWGLKTFLEPHVCAGFRAAARQPAMQPCIRVWHPRRIYQQLIFTWHGWLSWMLHGVMNRF